nr:immunoglobulin light chain junction region [Macaca mulatta]
DYYCQTSTTSIHVF